MVGRYPSSQLRYSASGCKAVVTRVTCIWDYVEIWHFKFLASLGSYRHFNGVDPRPRYVPVRLELDAVAQDPPGLGFAEAIIRIGVVTAAHKYACRFKTKVMVCCGAINCALHHVNAALGIGDLDSRICGFLELAIGKFRGAWPAGVGCGALCKAVHAGAHERAIFASITLFFVSIVTSRSPGT